MKTLLFSNNLFLTTFYSCLIKLPIYYIDAILGAEFFFEHCVVIDFKNREVYFSPDKKAGMPLSRNTLRAFPIFELVCA